MLGHLPDPGKNWRKFDGPGTTDGPMQYSWINFKNTESGDVLSFVAWEFPDADVMHSPVRQASIETFNSDGFAFLSTSVRGSPIADMIRNRPVFFDGRNHAADMRFRERALEYTYVFESRESESSTIAHGYVMTIGDAVVFVRHTSKQVITSDLARDMASGLFFQHWKTITGIDSGWSLGLDQDSRDDRETADSKGRTSGSSQ
jgi:hypothetical protein